MSLSNSEIRLALQIALLGEIYSAIRAIVFSYKPKKKSFLLRFYLDREVTEEDYENVGIVMTEFISNFNYLEFDELLEECHYSKLPISKLEPLDGFVYCKKEE